MGKELTAGVNYSTSINNSTLRYDHRSYAPDYTPLPTPPLLETHTPVNANNLFIMQADYIQPMPRDMKLETGIRSSLRNFNNELLVQVFNNQTNNLDIDRLRTNHFTYNEQINALYAIFSGKLKKLQYQFGNRLEHTYLKTDQLATKENSSQAYLSYFPSFFLLKKLPKNQQVQFGFSRRINRPTVGQLNPVTNFPDPVLV